MKEHRKGFIPVMLTPFNDNGEIDYDGLTALTELYLESGAAGLFANCLSSEMFELTAQERLDITRHVVKVANGAVPVVATGTFGGAIGKQADFVKRIYDTGVEAVITITGLLADEREPDAVFNERVFALMDQTAGIPLGFYECPDPYKRVLSAGQLKQFVETGRVIYHKDTCLDIDQIRDKLSVTVGYEQFGLYDAYMVHAVESLRAGSAGLSCIQGNYFPELIVWLCENYDHRMLEDEVNSVQQFLRVNMEVMHRVYPVAAKYFLQKRGMNISGFTRRNVGELNGDVKKDMDVLADNYRVLCDGIAIGSAERLK